MASYQFLPPLSRDERQALAESIKTFGVLQPVITDEAGNVIDGHHRAEIATEAGADYPRTVLPGLTEEQKVEQALILNLGRRHLSGDQKRQLVTDLRERGLSIRWISEKTGIPKSTVQRLAGVPGGTPEYVTGQDGKRYRATRDEEAEVRALVARARAARLTAETIEREWYQHSITTGEVLLDAEAQWIAKLRESAVRRYGEDLVGVGEVALDESTDDFDAWLAANFNGGKRTARFYMALALTARIRSALDELPEDVRPHIIARLMAAKSEDAIADAFREVSEPLRDQA
jgi:ParB-like chromosome segregation protein Spo0J